MDEIEGEEEGREGGREEINNRHGSARGVSEQLIERKKGDVWS